MLEQLPTGWVTTTLGEITRPSQDRVHPDLLSNLPYVGLEHIEPHTMKLLGHAEARDARSSALRFSNGDVLYGKMRPYLNKVWVATFDGVCSAEFLVFRDLKALDSRFLAARLNAVDFVAFANRQVSGERPRIDFEKLASFAILLPPLAEQSRIAATLDSAFVALQRADAAAHRASERVQRYRTAVLEKAVTGDLTSAWREKNAAKGDREPASRLLARILDARHDRLEQLQLEAHHGRRSAEPVKPTPGTELRLPRGWVFASLDELMLYITDGDHQPPPKTESGIPFLVIGNVSSGQLDFAHTRFVSEEYAATVDKFRKPTRGDILYTVVGTFGLAVSVDTDREFCIQRHLAILRPHAISPTKYLLLTLNSSYVFRQTAAAATGTAQPTVSLGALRRTVIPLPPLSEQEEIVRQVEQRLAAADRLAETLNQQFLRVRAARQALLTEGLAGRLVAQDPTDEPAVCIVERVHIASEQHPSRPRPAPRRTRGGTGAIMQEPTISPEALRTAWLSNGKTTDARRLFDRAGFRPDQVVQFYETLREAPDVRAAFQAASPLASEPPHRIHPVAEQREPAGRFRLLELWLEDFKNLTDYTVRFDPTQGLDVVLGWNGTGKSNLFESLLVIFRDLHGWWERNRWPEKPMCGFRLTYEMEEHVVEVTWRPGAMKRPELRRGRVALDGEMGQALSRIKRSELPLPRFVFGYYSGPTNRLAEHFLPMKQAHYTRLREASADDASTLASLLEQRRFFCAEPHHAKYVLLGFSYKEDSKISEFLDKRLRIVGFESALFIIRKPQWAKPGSRPDDFWGATGIMRRVMERLRGYAAAPMVLEQQVNYGYRSAREDHYYFFLPDLKSLHSFAAEYNDARTFFLALESTDFSELIHDVKIQVRVRSSTTQEIAITFHQLSEGEQQLLTVLGLMRFTKSHQSLVLLDEPDTHLNPHWSVDYLKDLAHVMSDTGLVSAEQQTSQILVATHDPLVIASAVKEQIHLLKRDPQTGECISLPATVSPRGLGFTGILTSEMFGFRSDLDPETLADLDTRVRLVAKEEPLTAADRLKLEEIDKRLVDAGFSKAFSDPYYAAFVRAWGRRHSKLMEGELFLTSEQRDEIDRVASEVLLEAIAEVERETAS
jgi:restriction endonuclease S subunit/predicted ATPase